MLWSVQDQIEFFRSVPAVLHPRLIFIDLFVVTSRQCALLYSFRGAGTT
jgi:hypothetical protein